MITEFRCKTHHKGFVHKELLARCAVVVFGVDGEAEKQHIHHDLEDGQEAVGHQKGEQAHDDERQHPLRVVPLIVQSQHSRKSCTCHDQDLQTNTHHLFIIE